jgi:hypothetical protein
MPAKGDDSGFWFLNSYTAKFVEKSAWICWQKSDALVRKRSGRSLLVDDTGLNSTSKWPEFYLRSYILDQL